MITVLGQRSIGTPQASGTVTAGRLIPGIHALRGLAAIAVVLFHFAHLTSVSVPDPLRFVAVDFAKGVYLFFVLSAFSLMYSTTHHVGRPQWVWVFFTKRFWRIAPLFYLVLMLVAGWHLVQGTPVDAWRVLLNLAFATAFSPQDGMVPAGWTVGVEMLFYVLFPVLLLTARTLGAAIILSIVATMATCAGRILLFRSEGDWANYMLPSNLCFFAYGLLAYHIVHGETGVSLVIRRVAPVLSLMTIVALLAVPESHALRQGAGLVVVLWGLAFALLCTWRGVSSSKHGNPLLHYFGERSYSIYLMHPLVIWLLRPRLQSLHAALSSSLGELSAWLASAAVLLIAVLVAAEATYRFVELPGIRVGGWFNRRRQHQVTLGTP